jgi:phage host-nuclease inhibitor protein Gam
MTTYKDDEIPNDLFTMPKDSTLTQKLARLIDLKYELIDLTTQLDDCKNQFEQVEAEAFDQMLSEGVQNIKIGQHKLYLNPRTYISVKAAEKDTAFAWLRRNGYDHLIKTKEDCHAGTLTAEMKTRLEEGGDVPDELFNIATKNKIGMRQSKS